MYCFKCCKLSTSVLKMVLYVTRGQRLTSLTKPDPLQNNLHLQWWNPEAWNNDIWLSYVQNYQYSYCKEHESTSPCLDCWVIIFALCSALTKISALSDTQQRCGVTSFLCVWMACFCDLKIIQWKQCVSESLLTSVRGDGAGSGETIGGSKDYTEDSKLLTVNFR